MSWLSFGWLLVVRRRLRANISTVKTKHCSHKEPFYGLISCQRPRYAAFEVSSEPGETSVGQAVTNAYVFVRVLGSGTHCLWFSPKLRGS